jgi:hypothetical protein
VSIGQGTKLGAYEVQDFIGQGAMGLVYRAYHAQLERTGAIKVMQAITPDVDTVARFRHEAQAIAKLRHPNIVDVYDFGEFQGTPYMIVEYIPGGSLAATMAHGPLDQKTALKYLRGIASGLDYAHGHGVVHRDVKPANVLLTAEDTPVLADFGLAKLLQGSSLKSMTGVTTGTPAYMAPEQVTGHQVGPAADRYSLATIAYEMLTGVIPFDGEALMELLYAQVHRDPPAPSSRQSALNPEVDGVLLKGLAKNPAERWESATAFVDALEAALAASPEPAIGGTMLMAPSRLASTRPLGRTAVADRVAAPAQEATVAMAFPAPPAAVPAAAQPQPKRSRRRLVIGLAALLMLVLLLGVCAVAAQATTLSVNPVRASRGEMVRVVATRVPANQVGEIQLHSVVHTYPFRANGRGQVEIQMRVPSDVELGDHVVKICWDNACHKDAPLRVVAGVAQASPSPSPTGSPSPSPTTTTSPSPGTTPRPSGSPSIGPTPSTRPTPTAGSTPHPTSTPTTTPKPTPKPTPSPSPTPNPCPVSGTAALTASPTTAVGGTTVTLAGAHFTPGAQVTLKYYVGTATTPTTTWLAGPVACGGTFSSSVATKGGLVRNDRVIATDTAGRSASVTIHIVL